MSQNLETIRELNVSELDEVGGGLGLSGGVQLDLSQPIGAVSGVIGQAGNLAGAALDKVLGAAGGLLGRVRGGISIG